MTPVKFDFEIGHYNGTMSLDIVVNGRNILHKGSFESDRYSFATEVEWPCLVELQVSGKNQNQDTLVDESGQVVKDKYIKLLNLQVGGIESRLNNITLQTDTTELTNTYFGFNGTVPINFDGPDSFMWHLKQLASMSNKEIYVVNYPPNSLRPES